MSAWPATVDVLPHRPPMVLVDRIVSHDATQTVCALDITSFTPFLCDGVVPAWVGVEYMAQCVAAHAGLLAHARGETVRPGLLIGARSVDFHVDGFTVGQTIVVHGVHVWGERTLASFECTLTDDRSQRRLARGVLSVYSPPNGGAR